MNMSQIKATVRQKVANYDLLFDLCREAAEEIRKHNASTIAQKKDVSIQVANNILRPSSILDVETKVFDHDEWHTVEYIVKGNGDIYSHMAIRFDDESQPALASWFFSELTDSDINIEWGDNGECMVHYVERPDHTEEEYINGGHAVWEVNGVNPYHEHWIVDYAAAGDTTFDEFFCDYCDHFGIIDREEVTKDMAESCEEYVNDFVDSFLAEEDWEDLFTMDDKTIESCVCDSVDSWFSYYFGESDFFDYGTAGIEVVPGNTSREFSICGVDGDSTWWKKSFEYTCGQWQVC